jgi:signal peptidase I
MNTLTGNDNWRPAPWIAAVLGLFFGGGGLLYVQRPWWAVAAYAVPLVAVLGALFAVWQFDLYINFELLSLSGWAVGIACAVYAFKVAVATPAGTARKWYSRWLVLIAIPLATFAVIFLVRAFVFETYRIRSQSMQPTIPENTYVFVAKSGFGYYGAYGITIWRGAPTATIARGDIVAHRLARDPATTYLHRIVGLPGDRIEYTNRRLVINGNTMPLRLEADDGMYQYALERLDGHETTIALMPRRASRDWAGIVPPEHYFVLGDSRDNSRDSRFAEVGFVPRDHIVGRVVKIVKEPIR